MKLPTLPKMPVTRSYKAATVGRDHCEAASGDLAHCGLTSGTHLGYNLERPCRWCRINRQGAAAVEFAIIFSFVFLPIMVGMIEAGRAIMVQQVITNASREGARLAVLDGTTVSDVEERVRNYLQSARISGEIVYTNPDPTTAADGDPVTVTVEVPYSSVSWIPTYLFFKENLSLSASTVMRRETVQ